MSYVSESDMSFARICLAKLKRFGIGRTLAVLAASYLVLVAIVKLTDFQGLDWVTVLIIALFFWVLVLLWIGFLAYDILAIVSCVRMGTRGKVAAVLSVVVPFVLCSWFMRFGSMLFNAMYVEFLPFITYVALEVFVLIVALIPGGSGDGDESLSKAMHKTVRKTAKGSGGEDKEG